MRNLRICPIAPAILIGALIWLILAVSLARAQSTGVTPTKDWVDFYSYQLTFQGVPVPVGTLVGAFDAEGTQCGERATMTAGYLSPVMPCYGDNSGTTEDEGAEEGDLITFKVNGVPAAATAVHKNCTDPDPLKCPPFTSPEQLIWHAKDVWDINLSAGAQPRLTITHEPGLTRLSWQPAQVATATYEVWRSAKPHFLPGDAESVRLGTVTAGTAPLEWTDTQGVGSSSLNYEYLVTNRNTGNILVGASQLVGEFNFELYY